jgi:hypothetical protein
MKKFFIFLGFAGAVIMVSCALSLGWTIFYSEKPACSELSFQNKSGQGIKSISIDSDRMHSALIPDAAGNFERVFIGKDTPGAGGVEMSFLFSDGTTLKSFENITDQKVKIVIYRDKTAEAIERADAW